MDVPLIIRHRLQELGLGQRDLARAAQVTESYVSQLLSRRKAPPAPNRTDIYDRMDKFLRLPRGELAKLAGLQRKEELKRELGNEATPLFREVRELVLQKCQPDKAKDIRAIFETQPFGELERLVTLTLLDVAKEVARQELDNKYWLRMVAQLGGRSYEEMRVVVLEFLDTDLFHVSAENCVSFLDPLIESWDIDLATFRLEIALSQRVAGGCRTRIRAAWWRRVRAQPVLAGYVAQRHGDRRGTGVSQAAAVQRQAAHGPLLLSGAAEPQGSAAFSHREEIRLGLMPRPY